MYSMFLMLSGAILLFLLYYEAYPFWAAVGLTSAMTDSFMLSVHPG